MSTRSPALVSVVTPVYNGERYLAECIESVCKQTYSNWRYIIVNNCSTDRTLEIAQSYAARDPRIAVVNNTEFLPVVRNWNHALELIPAESKYCKVVHADDWLYPECIERMVELAEANPSVGLVGSYVLWGKNNVECTGLPYPSTVTDGRKICYESLRGDYYVFGVPSSVLMRADLVRKRKAFYDENYLHADTEVCYRLLLDSDFGFIHQVLSAMRIHEKGVTGTVVKPYDTVHLERVALMLRYGPIYCPPDEQRRLLRYELHSYYRILAKSVFKFRGRDYLAYHRRRLPMFGLRLSYLRLVFACVLLISEYIFNPKAVLGRFTDRLRVQREKHPVPARGASQPEAADLRLFAATAKFADATGNPTTNHGLLTFRHH